MVKEKQQVNEALNVDNAMRQTELAGAKQGADLDLLLTPGRKQCTANNAFRWHRRRDPFNSLRVLQCLAVQR